MAELRTPVKKFESACSWGADKVGPYVTSATKKMSSFETTVVKTTDPLLKMVPGPITAISKPVIPYMQKGEKTVGRTGLIAASMSVPIAAVALITSPVWMFFGLITCFFWVPVVFLGALFLAPPIMIAVVAIFASTPASRKQLETKWAEIKKYISNSQFKTLFYKSPSTTVTTKVVKSTVPDMKPGSMWRNPATRV